MSVRFAFYKIPRKANLGDPKIWDDRFQDIDNRLAARELDAEAINKAVDDVVELALSTLNQTFMPIINEAQSRLNSLGASFSAESTSSVLIGTGTKNFTLTDESAENYVYTDYVSARSEANSANNMLGQVVTFDRPNKLLTLNVVSTGGSGTFADWLIRVGTPPDLTHATRVDNPHCVTAAQLGNPAGTAPAYTAAQTDSAIEDALASLDLSVALQKTENLNDLPNKATARTNLGLGALALLSTVGYGDLASNIPATAANFLANTASKFLTPNAVWAAADWVNLTDASTIAWNCQSGINFWVTLGGNRVLGFPTNPRACQSGLIFIAQDGTGNRTLGFQAGFTFDQGNAPLIDPVANRISVLWYFVRTGGEVFLGMPFSGVRGSP